ncbi:MAG: hypothetical protein SGPRY_012020 [Prymnesium sp.]
MTKLKADKSLGLRSVRFFGKILTCGRPYWVVEGVLDQPEPQPAFSELGPSHPEPPGTGLNACVYFVSNDVCEPFTKLADVVAASKIKKYLTGDLSSPVTCFPPFPGDESVFLRAQIARIVAATVLVPQGKLQVDEESEEVIKPLISPEEYSPVEANEMINGESWCHLYGGVLNIGRCTNPPKPEPEEGEEEEEEENLEEEVAPLAPLSDDKPVVAGEEYELPAWSFKLCFTQGGNYTVAVATSHRWPGAYSVAVQKADKFASVYFGYGIEYTGASFTPQAPPPILREAEDPEELPDVSLAAENEWLKVQATSCTRTLTLSSATNLSIIIQTLAPTLTLLVLCPFEALKSVSMWLQEIDEAKIVASNEEEDDEE